MLGTEGPSSKVHVAADAQLGKAEFLARAVALAELGIVLRGNARLRVWCGPEIGYDGSCPTLPAYVLSLLRRAHPCSPGKASLALSLERFAAAVRYDRAPSALVLLGDFCLENVGQEEIDRIARASAIIEGTDAARVVTIVGSVRFHRRAAGCPMSCLGAKLRVHLHPCADLSGIARELAR